MLNQTIKNLKQIITQKEAMLNGNQEHDSDILIDISALEYAITKLDKMKNDIWPRQRMTRKTAEGYEFTDDLLYGEYAEELLRHVGLLEDEAELAGLIV